ncbi:MAG TPA: HypC/HybG/HupF family hydrogenase formation chaperone [Anaerolineaceae bacterium]|nr:HypC/HybG/HupF family hydrogenase formation chaperone [Anaerolineaceae bacterium]
MCLAVPGKIVEVHTDNVIRMGKVDFGGVFREVCLEAVPDAVIGNYVIIHAGYALNTLSEEEAQESLAAFRELDEIENGFSVSQD